MIRILKMLIKHLKVSDSKEHILKYVKSNNLLLI